MGDGGVSTPQLLCRTSASHRISTGLQSRYIRNGAYAEMILKLPRNVEACDLNGNLSTLELTLVYRGRPIVLRHFCDVAIETLNFHRVWNRFVGATKFAQFIELFRSIVLSYGTLVEILYR